MNTFADKLTFKILYSKLGDYAKSIGFKQVREYTQEDDCWLYRKGDICLDVLILDSGVFVRVYKYDCMFIPNWGIYEVTQLDFDEIVRWVKRTIIDVKAELSDG